MKSAMRLKSIVVGCVAGLGIVACGDDEGGNKDADAAADVGDGTETAADVASDGVDADSAAGLPGFAPRPEYRPLTKFENRGLRLGHGVWDLVFIKR